MLSTAARLLSASLMAPRLGPHRAALHATRMVESVDWGYDAAPSPPSEKQIKLAQRLAQEVALELPPQVITSKDECSSFIDRALNLKPPTEKQVEFARTIALTANIELPEHAIASSKAVSMYIEANQHLIAGMAGSPAGMSNRPPTDKQLLFAANLARQRNVGLSAEALQSRQVISTFIDESQELLRSGGGAINGGGAFGGGMSAPMPMGAMGAMGAMGTMGGAAAFNGAAAGDGDDLLSAAEAAGAPPGVAAADVPLDGLFAAKDEEEEEPPPFREGSIPF